MNTQISELSEIALSVSHTLKGFDSKTMFWSGSLSCAYPNYNMLEVKPYPDVRKPFGVQAVLESFAKSVGFKTYNGLLKSELKSIQLRKDALNHLNPNPLNPYYTERWERLCAVIMEDAINNELVSVNLIRNFKQNSYLALLPYLDKSAHNCVTVHYEFTKRNKMYLDFHIEDRLRKYIPYYSIASSMYCMALEKLVELKGCSDWFKEQDFDTQIINECCAKDKSSDRTEIRIPVVDMLNNRQWDEGNHSKFLQDIMFAMAELFSVIVRFEGEGKSPLDKVAVFKIKTMDVAELMVAKLNQHNFENYKKACDVVLKAVGDDRYFYTCNLVEGKKFNSALLDYCAQNINHKYEGIHLKAVNGEKYFARKVFWVNSAYTYINLFSRYDIHTKHHSNEREKDIVSMDDCVALIEKFMADHLNAVVVIEKKNLSYGEKTPFKQNYVITTNTQRLERIIPRYYSVDSNYPLDHYSGEIFIQEDLLYLLSKEGSVDLDYKLVGHPDVLSFVSGEQIRINRTLANVEMETICYFYATNMVQNLKLYLDYELEEKVGLPVRSVEDKQLYYETDQEVYFSFSLRFADMFYKFKNVEQAVIKAPNLVMLATLNKETNKLSVKHQSVCEDEEDFLLLDYEECPNKEQICNFVLGMEDIHEMVLGYFMLFYKGKYKDLIQTVDKNETFSFGINPIDVTSKDEGYLGLDDILDSELTIQ